MENISIKPFPGKPRVAIHLQFCLLFLKEHIWGSVQIFTGWMIFLSGCSSCQLDETDSISVVTTLRLTRMDQHYSDKEKAGILGCKCLPGLHVRLYEY